MCSDEGSGPPFQVQVHRPGDLSKVGASQIESRAPEQGEVQVAIRYAGLNFRDVLRALGTFPAEWSSELLLGDEAAGVSLFDPSFALRRREVGPEARQKCFGDTGG